MKMRQWKNLFMLVLVLLLVGSCSNDGQNADKEKTYSLQGDWLYTQSNGGMLLSAGETSFDLKKINGQPTMSSLLSGSYVAQKNSMTVTANGYPVPVPYTRSDDELTITVNSTLAGYLGLPANQVRDYTCYKKIDSSAFIGTWKNAAKKIEMNFTATDFTGTKKVSIIPSFPPTPINFHGSYQAFHKAILLKSQAPRPATLTLNYLFSNAQTLEIDLPAAIVDAAPNATGTKKVVFSKQ